MKRLLFILSLVLPAGCTRTAPEAPPGVVEQPKPVVKLEDFEAPPPRAVLTRSPQAAFALGVDYLLGQQSADGAWRSDVYATFKDGTALTPLAVTTLQDALDGNVRNHAIEEAIRRGLAWLAKLPRPDGSIDPGPDGFDYPIYTATLTVKAFSHPSGKEHLKLRDGWVQFVKDRQLTEKLGWKPDEKQYGGWGYCRVIPTKPEPGKFAPPLIESNLSATLYALDALRAAGVADEAIYKAAAVFVRRCQNFPPEEKEVVIYPLPVNDGGFHFIYDDPVRNKAGQDGHTPPVFHSYGSTTADGLRALELCGLAEDQLRCAAARNWLQISFKADKHPGYYIRQHEANRNAVYYYYAASVARAFAEYKLTLPGNRDWVAELRPELVKRQKRDGSWTNPIDLVRENDPIVATCNAVSALSRCIK
jgi:hypothetical protein